ncbi:MAG TPA: PQQ-binding-like beta-propeller repeat protein [Vicinamibacterales bacterium]|nr:PQQ-binding-like beta-propeller repeat protein [Vicinamibacterales bacterium]
MRRLTMVAAFLATAVAAATLDASQWPQWRGPFNTGMAAGDAPLRWDDRTNIRWKLAIPGRGHSTPVVAGDRLFLTTAVPTGRGRASGTGTRAGGGADAGLEHEFLVMAIDRDTGDVEWQRTATVATPHEGYHRTYGSFASNSPVTDGTRVFAFFGSRGLYAYDLDGTPLWQKDFGVEMRMDMAFGEGTPLTLQDDHLLLHFDHLDTGFLVMLDVATGREIWRTKRTEPYNWAAPYVATHDGRRQVIVNGLTVRGYDYETGTLLWEADGLGENTIPQVVQHDDLVFAMSGHTVKMLMAIRLGHRGDLSGSDAVVWSTPRGAAYTPSPVLHEGTLYVVSDNGLLSAFDAATGEPHYQQERLPKPYSFKASPVGAGGRLYLATEDEDVVVVRMGPTFDVLATNTLAGQSFIASPVVVEGDIYLRSRTHLFRIGDD